MKLIKILFILLISTVVIFDTNAMKKRKEIEREEATPAEASSSASKTSITSMPSDWQTTEPKKYKFDWAGFEKLPRDIQIVMLFKIVETSKNINEAVKALQNLQATNKKFYDLINADDVNVKLIVALADRFLHGNALQAAGLLHTAAATEWSHLVLPEYIRAKILKIIQDDKTPEQIINSIKLYMNSRPLIKKALHNEYAVIWLIRTISKNLNGSFMDLNDEYENASALAAMLYETIESPQLQKWLVYADKQIANANVLYEPQASAEERIKHLQKLTAQGINIADDLVTQSVAYSHYRDPQILQLFIDAGATLNEQDRNGDTILHDLAEVGTLVRKKGSPQPGVFTISVREMNPEEKEERLRLFEFLLQSGANPNIKNEKGQTALSIIFRYLNRARLMNDQQQIAFYDKLVDLLMKHGAR